MNRARVNQFKTDKDIQCNDVKRNHKSNKHTARGVKPKAQAYATRQTRMRKPNKECNFVIGNGPEATSLEARTPHDHLLLGKNQAGFAQGPNQLQVHTHTAHIAHPAHTVHNAPMFRSAPMPNMSPKLQGTIKQPYATTANLEHHVRAATMATNSRRLGNAEHVDRVDALPALESCKPKKIKLANAFLLPDKENRSFVYLCKPVKKVRELLTARSLQHSSEELRQDNVVSSDTLCEDQDEDFDRFRENCAAVDFELAPLLQMSTSSSNAELSSSRVFMHVREMMRRNQHELLPEEIDTIKDVIKTDARHRRLKHDDELFRDILRTQLQEICKQESIVKTALLALESQEDTVQEKEPIGDIVEPETGSDSVDELKSGFKLETPSEAKFKWKMAKEGVSVVTTSEEKTATVVKSEDPNTIVAIANPELQMEHLAAPTKRNIEIDLVFKNIPTLQREIEMLQTIGEKLETTLKTSLDGSHGHGNGIENLSSSVYYTPCEDSSQLMQALKYPTVLTTITFSCSLERATRGAASVVRTYGIRHCYGSVKEFRIEQKTLTELKNAADDNKWFYIPVNEARTELKRTNFKRLKENPGVLMQFLKPRSCALGFNLLEQDPMFFHSVMGNQCNSPQVTEANSEHVLLHGSDSYMAKNDSKRSKWLTLGAAVATAEATTYNNVSKQYNEIRSTRKCDIWHCKCRSQQLEAQLGSFSSAQAPFHGAPLQKPPLPPSSQPQSSQQQSPQQQSSLSTYTPTTQQFFIQQYLNESQHSLPLLQSPIEQVSQMVDASTATNPSVSELSASVKEIQNQEAPAAQPPIEACPSTKINDIEKPKSVKRLSGGKQQQQQQQHQQQLKSTKFNSIKALPVLPLPSPRLRRRTITPLPIGRTVVEPKSHLLKTVIVGVMQIMVFLLLIMAFTYPDIHC